MIYNNHAKHTFESKNSAKNEKKNPQGKEPCGFNFVVNFVAANLNRKISCCEIFTKIYFLFSFTISSNRSLEFCCLSSCSFLSFFFLRYVSVVVPIFYLPPSSLFFLVALFSRLIISTGLFNSCGIIPTTTTLVGCNISHIS